ncbi:hypothetical protein SBDP1_560006 [Syntrophobacter sp. SbD1]|nr:hypothetical protein SBDP1_560006 [Syntrophobacter sp. SbD1]
MPKHLLPLGPYSFLLQPNPYQFASVSGKRENADAIQTLKDSGYLTAERHRGGDLKTSAALP